MSKGYVVSWVTFAGIQYRLNDNVTTFLQRNGMIGFGPMAIDTPAYRRPLMDGTRPIGRRYTGERQMGVKTDVFCDTHEELAAFLAGRFHDVNPYDNEELLGSVRVDTPDGRVRYIDALPGEMPVEFMAPTVGYIGHGFKAFDPWFYDPVEKEQSFNLSTPGGLLLPAQFPIIFSATTIDSTLQVLNAGELATWPRLRIYGPGLSPIISNLSTGQWISLNNGGALSLDTGDYVDIDTRLATIWLHDADAPANDRYIPEKRTKDSTFWQLRPGDNSIHVTMSNVTVGSAVLNWYQFYRSGY